MISLQNYRWATGCYLKSDIDRLHVETKVLPLRQHSTMLTKQFLVSSFKPAHPGNKHLKKPPPARTQRKTSRIFKEEVGSKFQEGKTYKETIKCLHTETVQNCLKSYEKNKVLNRRAPEVNPKEIHFPGR